MKKKLYKGTALDLIQAAYMERHVPLIYCYMLLDTAIDINRLKQAVRNTAKIVPQILCRYDDRKNTWLPAKYDSNSIVQVVLEQPCYEDLIWDLRIGPQLRIHIYRQKSGDFLQIAMSHILTDGAGFQQYLSLLCKFYNEQTLQVINEVNSRSLNPLLFHTPLNRLMYSKSHAEKGNMAAVLPLDQAPAMLHSLKVILSEEQLNSLQEKAKSLQITLNDLFMASYVYALKSFSLQSDIVLPCPADLRKFHTQKGQLTIANMTGKYLCHISPSKSDSLKELTLAIHQEMERMKSHYACFHFIPLLQLLYMVLPVNLLQNITRAFYSIEQISYTNMGRLEAQQILFQDIVIKECYLCGTYRKAPSFQVSISTYKNTCTMAVNLYGTKNQKNTGMQLLNDMKSALLDEL